jgi:hypothetical protein
LLPGGQPYYDEAVAEVAGLAFEKRHECHLAVE